jgi:hypothetical protein
MNQNFTDIKTLLNTTGLDDTNIQNAGISPTTKLKSTGAAAGQVLGYNGSAILWVTAALGNAYNVIFGSSAQVTAGVATNSTFSSWTQADGDRVLILPGYSESASWTLTKKVFIQGLGATSQITGSAVFATGSTNSSIQNCRMTTGVTVNSGVVGVQCNDVWFPAGITFTDNSTALANYLVAMQES